MFKWLLGLVCAISIFLFGLVAFLSLRPYVMRSASGEGDREWITEITRRTKEAVAAVVSYNATLEGIVNATLAEYRPEAGDRVGWDVIRGYVTVYTLRATRGRYKICALRCSV